MEMAPGNIIDGVPRGILELILSRLPMTSLLRATQVSKSWCSIVRSREFVKFYDEVPTRKSWFYMCCISYLNPDKNKSFAYDPESNQWHIISSKCFPDDPNKTALASSPDGVLYSVFTLSDLCYKREFLSRRWEEAPQMNYSRNAPLLGLATDSASNSYKLVVCGGVALFEDNHLAVEMYDSVSSSWEVCESMPVAFSSNSSRHWMTSAVVGGKFFVAEVFSGLLAAFELGSKRWSIPTVLRPHGVVHSYLLCCRGNFLLAGSCYVNDEYSFKLWKVDVSSMDCGVEIARMPSELCSIFGPSDDGPVRKGDGVHCVASGDLIYVFSRDQYRDNQVVVCDLSSDNGDWKLLPSLPSKDSFNHVVGFSSPVKLDSLLR